MTRQEYAARGLELSRQAGVLDTLHGYFVLQLPRLHQACELFGVFEGQLGDVLEVGPFYSYTPFLLRANARSYTVLEGDDPAAYPLKPLYDKHAIKAEFDDLFELFGPKHGAPHALKYPDASFDTVLCWETMEHFNFNPVKFVRELLRVTRPGGRVCITVPNRASFQGLAALVMGRGEASHIDGFFEFEEYVSNGKKAFYGFHWHEYTVNELRFLFEKAGFKVARFGTMVAFQEHARISAVRRLARGVNRVMGKLLPRFGTHVFLEGIRQPD
jgi:SAM-dependent methyltransferase